jgi:hypothetical protein
MITSVARVVLSILLVGGGLLCWAAADVTHDLASRYTQLATFDHGATPAKAGWTAPLQAVMDRERSVQPAVVAYWRGDYAAVSSNPSTETGDLLMAAHAMFRQTQALAGTGLMSVERLDRTLQAYAAALKNAGFSRDAAYNYEYVARLRDTIARSKQASARPSAQRPPEVVPADDLPTGPTIHGRPGTHPPTTRGEEFEVLTPMDYGEREAQPEPTPGRPLPRKG